MACPWLSAFAGCQLVSQTECRSLWLIVVLVRLRHLAAIRLVAFLERETAVGALVKRNMCTCHASVNVFNSTIYGKYVLL